MAEGTILYLSFSTKETEKPVSVY